MDENLKIIKTKFRSIIEDEYMPFTKIAAMKNVMGVYIIYSPDNEVIYVGSTNKFHVRFGVDLKHESTHTLIRKFLKQELFPERKFAVDYLINQCKFKVVECAGKREAEAVEHF